MRINIIQKLVNFNMANKPYFDTLVSNPYRQRQSGKYLSGSWRIAFFVSNPYRQRQSGK